MSIICLVVMKYDGYEGGHLLGVHRTKDGAISHVEDEANRIRDWSSDKWFLRRNIGESVIFQVLAPTRSKKVRDRYYLRSSFYEITPEEVRS